MPRFNLLSPGLWLCFSLLILMWIAKIMCDNDFPYSEQVVRVVGFSYQKIGNNITLSCNATVEEWQLSVTCEVKS